MNEEQENEEQEKSWVKWLSEVKGPYASKESFLAGWNAHKGAVFSRLYGPAYDGMMGNCLACKAEALLGTQEVPHPVDSRLHSCEQHEPKFRCRECHSTDVEHTMWVNPNTEEVGEIFGTWNQQDSSFCNDCGLRGCIEDVPGPDTNENLDET
jgi:hypothetical protein